MSRMHLNQFFEMTDMYQVAIWLQASDDKMLREIGHDLEPATFAHPEGFHVSTDMVACLLRLAEICHSNGRFKRGANATIAQCLFGDRSKTGGSYNRQIQAVKKQIQAMLAAVEQTTTTPEREPDPPMMPTAAAVAA